MSLIDPKSTEAEALGDVDGHVDEVRFVLLADATLSGSRNARMQLIKSNFIRHYGETRAGLVCSCGCCNQRSGDRLGWEVFSWGSWWLLRGSRAAVFL